MVTAGLGSWDEVAFEPFFDFSGIFCGQPLDFSRSTIAVAW